MKPMDKSKFSPAGQEFVDLYGPLLQDTIRAFAQIAYSHDKVSFSLLVKGLTDAAYEARHYMDQTDTQFNNAVEC